MTTIFTVNGFMGDMWAGPQADTGRALSNQGLAYWQPVGYQSNAFPLSTGVNQGLTEFRNLINQHPGPMLFSAWSEGAIIISRWYMEARAGGPQANRLQDLKGVTTFGNPWRQAGKWAPRTGYGAVPDPGGAGIGGPHNNLTDTPDWWHDYAHVHDMYTCCPVGGIGDDIRIVYDFILTDWDGAWRDLLTECIELASQPGGAITNIISAIGIAIQFFAGGTADHVNYDPNPSINYLSGIARTIR